MTTKQARETIKHLFDTGQITHTEARRRYQAISRINAGSASWAQKARLRNVWALTSNVEN
jgi:hypothetical protein